MLVDSTTWLAKQYKHCSMSEDQTHTNPKRTKVKIKNIGKNLEFQT